MQKTYKQPEHYLENVIRDRRCYSIDDPDTAMKAAWIVQQILDIKNVHICEVTINTRRDGVYDSEGNNDGEIILHVKLHITGGDIAGLGRLVTDIKGWSIQYSQFSVPSNGLWLSVGADFRPEEADIPTPEQICDRVIWLYKLIHEPIHRCDECDGLLTYRPFKESELREGDNKRGQMMCRNDGCSKRYNYQVVYDDAFDDMNF